MLSVIFTFRWSRDGEAPARISDDESLLHTFESMDELFPIAGGRRNWLLTVLDLERGRRIDIPGSLANVEH